MLQALRKRQRTLLAIFIGLISVVFVFWGFYGGFSPLSNQEVATVNGESVSLKDFQSQYQQTVSIYQNILKDKFTPETADRFNLKQLTLNQLIDQKLILQGAKSLGLQVTDAEIRDQLVETPYFQKNGKFDSELYKNILKANRLTPASF